MVSDKLPIRWATRFVIGYMMLAFMWWAIELWRENDRSFNLGVSLLAYQLGANNGIVTEDALRQQDEYVVIKKRWEKNRRMVFAEGLFFTLCLAFGLYAINRSVGREVSLARQRRNFMLSITHELKSPIAALRLAMETMVKRDLTKPQYEQLSRNGLRDAARLQALVEDLLLAARLEDNWTPLHEPVDLKALAEDVIRSIHTRFPHALIHLDVPGELSPVSLDKAGVTSMIQNLLENAVKYSPEGNPVNLRMEQHGQKLRIVVADQGYGIPDAEKESVFEKFYRIGNEETRKAIGTGLGLYIVKQVVHAHGGRISLSDNKPQGTVFVLEL